MTLNALGDGYKRQIHEMNLDPKPNFFKLTIGIYLYPFYQMEFNTTRRQRVFENEWRPVINPV